MAGVQPVTKRVNNGAIGTARRDAAGLAGPRRLYVGAASRAFACASLFRCGRSWFCRCACSTAIDCV